MSEASLANGLRILVLEKPGVPVVATLVAYRVGAVDERPGETGLAHYLEHMLFKGTKQIGKGQIDLLTFRGGGVNNAYTNCDFTAYWFTFEASRLRLALEIEADRMRNCTFVPKEFEAERGAVLNEMHAGHDAPGGRSSSAATRSPPPATSCTSSRGSSSSTSTPSRRRTRSPASVPHSVPPSAAPSPSPPPAVPG